MPDIDIAEFSGYDFSWSLFAEVSPQTFLSAVSSLDYFRLVGMVVLFFFWIVALIWTVKDAAARSDRFAFQLFAVVIVIIFTPILWLPLYIACRPQWFKWDKVPWREALLEKMQSCENCHGLNNIDHSCCVYCWDRLTHECRECSQEYSLGYSYCPFCWAPNIEK